MVKIANKVYAQEDLELQDGTEVVLKPLVIARLRRFMKVWEKMADLENDDEAFDVYIDCCGICLEKDLRVKFDGGTKAPADSDRALSEEYIEYLEDSLDLDTIYKIIEICAGIKLNDPKLLEAAMLNMQEDGEN